MLSDFHPAAFRAEAVSIARVHLGKRQVEEVR